MTERQAVADAIATDLLDVELAIEAAFAKTAFFLARLPERRAAANLSTASAHRLFSTLQETSSHLTSARGSIIETHTMRWLNFAWWPSARLRDLRRDSHLHERSGERRQ